jgi:hypothetical protein
MTDLLLGISVVFPEGIGDAPELRAALVFVHAVAIGWAVLWLPRRTRKHASRYVLPGFAGLICFLVAFWNGELILRWDTMFQHWLVPIAPRAFVAFTTKFMYPTVYLLGAWAFAFALALQMVLWRENKRKQEPISVSD